MEISTGTVWYRTDHVPYIAKLSTCRGNSFHQFLVQFLVLLMVQYAQWMYIVALLSLSLESWHYTSICWQGLSQKSQCSCRELNWTPVQHKIEVPRLQALLLLLVSTVVKIDCHAFLNYDLHRGKCEFLQLYLVIIYFKRTYKFTLIFGIFLGLNSNKEGASCVRLFVAVSRS